jgi:branched-chain amino acid transport system substrate-binding protein
MDMKRLSFIISIIATCFIVSCNNKQDTIKIGCLTPLTGQNNVAEYGKMAKMGIDFAISDFNKKSKTKFEIIYEDTKLDAKTSVGAINKLVFQKIPAIIGPFGSNETQAVAKIANDNKIVILGASAAADSIKYAGDYVFRIISNNTMQGKSIAEFAYNELNKRRAALFYLNNDYGISLKNSIEQIFTSLGGKIVFVAGSDAGNTNFTASIAKLKKQDIDVVFFTLQDESKVFLKRLSENAFDNIDKLTGDGAKLNVVIEDAGNAVKNCYFFSFGLDINNEKYEDFENRFKNVNGFAPDTYTSYYYEATMILLNTIGNQKSISGEEIKNLLYGITKDKPYYGITGETYFDSYGEVDKSFSIYQAVDNKFIFIK